jgi:hypothetical protein
MKFRDIFHPYTMIQVEPFDRESGSATLQAEVKIPAGAVVVVWNGHMAVYARRVRWPGRLQLSASPKAAQQVEVE